MQLSNAKDPIFFERKDLGKRPWGSEIQLGLSSGKWMLKLLRIKQGCKGGLQYHRIKDEGGIVIKGILKLRYYSSESQQIIERQLTEGDTFRFPPYCIHQEEALTDVEIIEISTPHLNDRVRCEQIFNPDSPIEGLPTTDLSAIITL